MYIERKLFKLYADINIYQAEWITDTGGRWAKRVGDIYKHLEESS
jgi:hypothetical protein